MNDMSSTRMLLAKAEVALEASRSDAALARATAALAQADAIEANAIAAAAKEHLNHIFAMMVLRGRLRRALRVRVRRREICVQTTALPQGPVIPPDSVPTTPPAAAPALDAVAQPTPAPLPTPRKGSDIVVGRGAAAGDSEIVGGAAIGYDSSVDKRTSAKGLTFGGIKTFSKQTPAPPLTRRGSSGWTKKIAIDWSAANNDDGKNVKKRSVKDIVAGLNADA